LRVTRNPAGHDQRRGDEHQQLVLGHVHGEEDVGDRGDGREQRRGDGRPAEGERGPFPPLNAAIRPRAQARDAAEVERERERHRDHYENFPDHD
jgi:hypothetical protein